MKKTLTSLFILFLSLSINSYAQICGCNTVDKNCICKSFKALCDSDLIIKERICEDIKTELESIKWRYTSDRNKKRKLVTDYTFRKKFRNDFAKILINENTFSSLNTHADLSIDEDKSKVSFSPFVFHHHNLDFQPFTYFGSLEFSGTVNDDQIFKLLDKKGINREFNINLNLNFIAKSWSSYRIDTTCFKKYSYLVECARKKVCEDYEEKINALKDSCNKIDDLVDNLDELCDSTALKKAIWNKFSDMEDKLSTGFWTWNTKTWFSVSLTPYGYKEFNAIDTAKKTLVDKNHYSPALKLAYNYLHNNVRNDKAIYFNIWGEIVWKNSFTEQSTTSWNYINKLTDSTTNILETKDVYAYDSASYIEEYLPNFGVQLIAFTDLCCNHFNIKFPVGIDITYRLNFLPALNKADKDYQKHIFSAGLVFPFNDKDGNRVINLEVFHSNTFYSIKKSNEEFWGLKFSLPIFSKK